jgi:hypothetical protein
MTVHEKTKVLMQARHLVEELIPSGWQYEQACAVGKALFSNAIDGISDRFHHVVPDFIWVVKLYFE